MSIAVALERLRMLHDLFASQSSSYLDHSTSLIREEWSGPELKSRFPALAASSGYVSAMTTSRISRKQVFDSFKVVRETVERGEKEKRLLEAFVAVMAWGFKPGSYGPWRTNEMLGSVRAPEVLQQVFEKSGVEQFDPLTAYRALSGKISRLGPAFGTKVLYFISPPENRAPILDAVVAEWLWRYGIRGQKDRWLNPVPWSEETYRSYVDFCSRATSELGVDDRGIIEYLIFVDAQYSDVLDALGAQPSWIGRSNVSGWPK